MAPAGAPIDTAEGRAAVAAGGAQVVFAAGGGPHARDLYVTARAGAAWSAPRLISADSPFAWNDTPTLAPDASRLVFDCGPEANAGPGGSICEVAIDGGAVTVVVGPDDAPAAIVERGPLHHGGYAGDAVVFEAAWDGERLWTTAAGGPRPLAPDAGNDNSPCVLPDGRIASLWLGRPGNPDGRHELKVVAATGGAPVMLVTDVDVRDDGLGCGR